VNTDKHALYLAYVLKRAEQDKALQHIEKQFIITDVARKFHRSNRRVKLFRGPNQAGKSVTGAREMVYCLLGYSPYRKLRPAPVEAKLSTFSFDQSMKAQRLLYKLIPPWLLADGCTFDPDKGFKDHKVTLTNGSTLTIFTDKQATLAHSSDTLDYVWFDEPPAQGKYGENLARLLVRSGFMWLTMTPIGAPVDWLKDEVQAGKIEDINFSLTTETAPHLTQTQIDEIALSYLDEEVDQRIHGAWEGVSPDRKFTQFKPQVHIIEAQDLPDRPLDIYIGADHGESSNNEYFTILGVYQELGEHHLIYLGEYTGVAGASPEQDAKAVTAELESIGLTPLHVTYGKGDVNSAGKLGAGSSINQLLERGFAKACNMDKPPFPMLKPDKRSGSVISGTRRINNGFAQNRIKVLSRCKQLIASFRYYSGADDQYKHAIDAARYVSSDFLRDTITPAKVRIS
jgi:phage terminase large subunit-like protein